MPQEQPDNAPTPEDAPLSPGNEEIEALLQQAESLVSDIAGSVGLEQSPALPTPMPEEADPLTAVEMATYQVEQLEEAVGEAPAEPDDVAPTMDMPDAVREFTGADAARDLLSAPVGAADLPAPSQLSAADRAPVLEPEETGHAPADSKSRRAATALAEPEAVPQSHHSVTSEGPVAETEAAIEESAVPVRRSLARRIGAVLLLVCRNILVAVPNSLIRLVILLDRPFAGLSPNAKLVLGMIAIVTLVMGGLAIALPKLMQDNPYSSIAP